MSRPDDRHQLLNGTYSAPDVEVGQMLRCVLRGRTVQVCGLSRGRIRWPLRRIGHGGKGAYIITPSLARAIQVESVNAICHWLGVGSATVTKWRRAFGVKQFNEGTIRLYSHWTKLKLPDNTVAFSPSSLRRLRIKQGLTQREVADKLGWSSINTYGQMESGRRRRAIRKTLKRLAAVFGVAMSKLLA